MASRRNVVVVVVVIVAMAPPDDRSDVPRLAETTQQEQVQCVLGLVKGRRPPLREAQGVA
jgi:hypothetical protein